MPPPPLDRRIQQLQRVAGFGSEPGEPQHHGCQPVYASHSAGGSSGSSGELHGQHGAACSALGRRVVVLERGGPPPRPLQAQIGLPGTAQIADADALPMSAPPRAA